MNIPTTTADFRSSHASLGLASYKCAINLIHSKVGWWRLFWYKDVACGVCFGSECENEKCSLPWWRCYIGERRRLVRWREYLEWWVLEKVLKLQAPVAPMSPPPHSSIAATPHQYVDLAMMHCFWESVALAWVDSKTLLECALQPIWWQPGNPYS